MNRYAAIDTEMKALLKNKFAPVTWTCGFVECCFPDFAGAFTKWESELDARFGMQTEVQHFHGTLPEALFKLEPLTSPLDRYLLIETSSKWTALFSNGLRVNDVFSPVSYLPQILKCRGLEVHCIPDRSEIRAKDALRTFGAVTFSMYGPENTDWLNRIRTIGVTNDVGGWEFATDGTIQPFENTESYRKRRIVDRFTPEMLESYCAALGIQAFEESFYGGQCLALHMKTGAPPGPTMSIEEARSHLYL